MNHDEASAIYQLSEAAVFAGMTLTLMAVQYAIVGSFVIVSWAIPIVLGIAELRLSPRYAALSLALLIGAAFLLFGLTQGLWMIYYISVGVGAGELNRQLMPRVVRVICLAVWQWFLAQGLVLVLLTLARMLTGELLNPAFEGLWKWWWMAAVGLSIVCLLQAAAIDKAIAKVCRSLVGVPQTARHLERNGEVS